MRSIGAPAVSDEQADEEDEDHRGGDGQRFQGRSVGRVGHDRSSHSQIIEIGILNRSERLSRRPGKEMIARTDQRDGAENPISGGSRSARNAHALAKGSATGVPEQEALAFRNSQ